MLTVIKINWWDVVILSHFKRCTPTRLKCNLSFSRHHGIHTTPRPLKQNKYSITDTRQCIIMPFSFSRTQAPLVHTGTWCSERETMVNLLISALTFKTWFWPRNEHKHINITVMRTTQAYSRRHARNGELLYFWFHTSLTRWHAFAYQPRSQGLFQRIEVNIAQVLFCLCLHCTYA